MTLSRTLLAGPLAIGCTVLALGIGSAAAGPCNTQAGNQASGQRDAGAGPTVGNTGQAPKSNQSSDSSGQHPPNATVGSAASGSPASSEDAQRQMQGQPTAAQQAQGMKSSGQDC